MSVGKDKTSWLISSATGLLLTLVIGAGLGYLFTGEAFAKPIHAMMTPIALGLVWALFLLQWLDLLAQGVGFSSNLIPEDLDLQDRKAAGEHAESISGGSMAARRAQGLLKAWSTGADAQQLIALVALQSSRATNQVRALAGFSIILLLGCIWQSGTTVLAWAAFVAVAVTLLARQNFINRLDAFLDESLLSRLPGGGGTSTAPTQAASANMGEALGTALKAAFKEYIPQPEKMSAAISESLNGSLAQHADSVQSASQQLAGQLDKISQLGQEIEKVLHVQQTVDNTLKAASLPEELQETLKALRTHVAESDKLMKEMAKPRKIRLVESHGKTTIVQQPAAPAEKPAPAEHPAPTSS